MKNITLIVVLALVVIIFSPFIAIWSLNTLFPVLAIPYTFETWLASLLLAGTLKTSTMKT
jgi:hypothetical protein